MNEWRMTITWQKNPRDPNVPVVIAAAVIAAVVAGKGEAGKTGNP